MSTRGDFAAFPVAFSQHPNGDQSYPAAGLTVREVFAKDAPEMPVEWFETWREVLAGVTAAKYAELSVVQRAGLWREGIAAWRVASADALLDALDDLAMAKQGAANLRSNLNGRIAAIASLEAQGDALRTELAEARRLLDHERGARDESDRRLRDFRAEVDALRMDLTKAKEEADALQMEATHQRERADMAEAMHDGAVEVIGAELAATAKRLEKAEWSLASEQKRANLAEERLVSAAERAMAECIAIWKDGHRARQVFDAVLATDAACGDEPPIVTPGLAGLEQRLRDLEDCAHDPSGEVGEDGPDEAAGSEAARRILARVRARRGGP